MYNYSYKHKIIFNETIDGNKVWYIRLLDHEHKEWIGKFAILFNNHYIEGCNIENLAQARNVARMPQAMCLMKY